MSPHACCICSTLLDTYDAKTEKPIIAARYLPCCTRAICQRCISSNPRYTTYCPYCQISTAPTTLPQGLRDPPPYPDDPDSKTSTASSTTETLDAEDDELPPYTSHDSSRARPQEKNGGSDSDGHDDAQDVLHFLTPDDTLRSLALAYKVPLSALRRTNNIFADPLLQARRTILIPGEFYKGGQSLSPRPIEGEEEELKKSKIRRWMVACKVAEYDVAVLYLEQADYELDAAIEAYKEDERWEKEHPLEGVDVKGKTKKKSGTASAGMRRFVGGG